MGPTLRISFLLGLVAFAYGELKFNETQKTVISTKLGGVKENINDRFVGVLTCSDDDTGFSNLSITLQDGSNYLELIPEGQYYTSVYLLEGKLDFEIQEDRNNLAVSILCRNKKTDNRVTFTTKLVITDVNDNDPIFERGGQDSTTNATYNTQIDEILTAPVPLDIYSDIIVRDADGVDNNIITAECEHLETGGIIIRPCDPLFKIRSELYQGTAGTYRFVISAQTNDYSNYSSFTMVIRAVNVPKDTTTNEIRYSKSQNVVININDIQNMRPLIDSNTLSFQMFENHQRFTVIDSPKMVEAYDLDLRNPNPVNFRLAPTVNEPLAYDEHFFYLGDTIPPNENEISYKVELFLNNSIDRESLPSTKTVFIDIVAFEYVVPGLPGDRNPMSSQSTISVQINDVNDNNPSFPEESYTIDFQEKSGTIPNPENYTQISNNIDLTVSDLDSSIFNSYDLSMVPNDGTFAFTKSGLTEREGFYISGYTLYAKNRILDYDNPSLPKTYTVLLKATDKDNPSLTGTCSIQVNIVDINDNLPTFTQPSYEFRIAENVPIGFSVGQVQATDLDSGAIGNIVEYSIRDTSGKFTVSPTTGTINTAGEIDYEAQTVYTFTVIAKDGGNREGEVAVSVNVDNSIDVGPMFPQNYSAMINEDETNLMPSITIKAINRESTGTMLYSVDKVFPDTIPIIQFSVDPVDGVVSVISPIDYKDTVGGVVIVTFRATSGNLFATTTLTIRVNDLNNFPPVFVNPPLPDNTYQVSISELTDIGEVVLTLSVTDEDGNATDNGIVVFQIQSGGNDAFDIKENSGAIFVSSSNLDRDQQDVYNIEVLARDKGNPVKSATAKVIVNIRDENNKAPVFNEPIYLFQMKEDDPIGQSIGQVSAIDDDDNVLLEYSISNTSIVFEKRTSPVQDFIDISKILAMEKSTGILKVAGPIDWDLYDRINLNVIVEDKLTNPKALDRSTGTASVVITIEAAVDPSIFFPSPWTKENPVLRKTYTETNQVNFQIMTLAAIDPTIPGPVRIYEKAFGSDPEGYFSIQNGTLRVLKPLDYETLPGGVDRQLSVVVLAIANDRTRTATATVIINVQDLNDNAPEFDRPFYTFYVDEDKGYATKIGSVKATDADSSSYGEIHYYLTGSNSQDFTVISRSTGVGDFTAMLYVSENATLDYEEYPEYNIQLVAEDNPAGSDNANNVRLRTAVSVRILLNDKNDNRPMFRENLYEFDVVGTKDIDGEVGLILADDIDAGVNGEVDYYIQSSTNDGARYFGIRTLDQKGAKLGEVLKIGLVYVRSSLEALSDRSVYELLVTAQDNGIDNQLTGTTTVRITVSKGVQDPKPKWNVGLPSRVTIYENDPVGTFVASITARAATNESGIIYSFIKGGDATGDYATFNIDPNTGRITTAKELDYEQKPIYSEGGQRGWSESLLILATDTKNATLTNQYLLVVQIMDVNDNNPSFLDCKIRKYSIPEVVYVSEGVPIESYVYQAVACDLDEAPNNYVQYQWYYDLNGQYCNQNTMNLFNLNQSTGVITTNTLLDREDVNQYLLCIEAKPKDSNRKRRDMVSDLKARNNHDTVLYLQVIVTDVNDNGPQFEDLLPKVIVEFPNVQIAVAEATDPDQPPNNVIRYSINKIEFTIKGKTQLAPTAFSINANDGTIVVGTNDYSDYVGGYFDIYIDAEDKNGPQNTKARTVQRVYVTNRANQIRVVFNQPADSGVEEKTYDMINELNGLEEGVFYEVKKISYHVVSNDEDPRFDRTDVCMVVVKDDSVMVAVDAAERLNSVREVDRVLAKYGAVDPGSCDPAKSVYPVGWESYWWVLVAFAIFIFICVCILIFLTCVLYRQYKRYMDSRKTYFVQTTVM